MGSYGSRVCGFFLGDGSDLKLIYVTVSQSVDILKIIELYDLNG